LLLVGSPSGGKAGGCAGETLIAVARAVAEQYANVTPVERVYPLVRSQKQLVSSHPEGSIFGRTPLRPHRRHRHRRQQIAQGNAEGHNYAECLADQTNKEIDTCIGDSEFSNCVFQRSLSELEVCDLSKC